MKQVAIKASVNGKIDTLIIKEGDEIFFEENGQIYSGNVINLTEETFELDSYGCCCEGHCSISLSQLGRTFFTSKEQIEKALKA